MLVGYARTSSIDQVAGLEAQIYALREAGSEKLFSEQISSVAKRDQLELALDFVREGDVLIATRLDRLARSAAHLHQIVEMLEQKKVALRLLDFGGKCVDTSSPSDRLLLNMFAAVAQFEREIMLERQREGIAKAKREGKYKGRAPTARAKATQVKTMHAEGIKPTEIANRLGIGRASVYRILAD
ncbi:recombinase family protein [Labrenzia sp. 011]|uniref:recombinase family protein n=1 Tax=Labrenzia sp. 011 TaxID=2171494 RepID=UPI000D50A868|nr:recombinase family protein [Labrenzia sp. 011]PVB59486.1 hypothetical protein DCO57_22115 [Labrenzia sp. 011]